MNRRKFFTTTGVAAVAATRIALRVRRAGQARADETRLPERAHQREARRLFRALRRPQHLRLSADCRWTPVRDRGRAEAHARYHREVRRQRRLPRAAVPRLQPHRPRAPSGHHAGAEPRARPRHRIDADADQELRGGRRPVDQVQHEHPRRAAQSGPHQGTRRRDLQHLAPEGDDAEPAR